MCARRWATAVTMGCGWLLLPTLAYADNCGSFSDCYNTLRAALAALVGVGLFAALLSFGLDLSPVGEIKGLAEAITGRDLITGEELAWWERLLGVVPFVGAIVGAGGGAGRVVGATDSVADAVGASRAADHAGDATAAGRAADSADDAAKARSERLEELAKDPAHGGQATPKGRHEAEVGLSLEETGKLSGPISREPSGAAEFIDANGVKWDVKSFNSNYPPRQGGFSLDRDLGKIEVELNRGENVILDTTSLSAEDVRQLREAIDARGWSGRILWYP